MNSIIAAMRAVGPLLVALVLISAGKALSQPVTAALPVDVPPWNWAYQAVVFDQGQGLVNGYPAGPKALAANSIAQVYAGLAHADAAGAQAWIERFTYDRPADWPAPLERSTLASFSFEDMRIALAGTRATAAFTARLTTRAGMRISKKVRVPLRLKGSVWQVDYTDLAARSSLPQ